ncbi:DUF1918 domain-containing protein [Kitasatospora camelliae]|uniref:DUF1918 domain-containing protein n=1 Tax=Kitasatospora camelliae TaxID=3156397 RepID=A0AAU8JS22_9ACTN
MQATVGDHVHIYGKHIGMVDRKGEIMEVRGTNGEPPYLVHFEDGHDGLIYPGPDTVIERQEERR